jgi:hypothetical protein
VLLNVNLLENTGIRGYWVVLFNRVKEVDPLTCPKRQGTMKVVGFIEDKEVIQKILKHLGIWLVKKKPSPKANDPPDNIEPHLDYSDCQLPPPARHRSRSGEAGGSYDYLYVDERYLKGPSA